RMLCIVGFAIILADAGAATPDASLGTLSVTLRLNASSSENVVGYHVWYGSTSGTYTQSTDVGDTTTATISPLSPNTAYYFVVTAYDTAQESGPSDEVSFTTPPSTPTPSPTATPSATPIASPSPTASPSATASLSPTVSPTPTPSPSPTSSSSPSYGRDVKYVLY